MDNSKITLGDLQDVLVHINKCMHAYKFWEHRFKTHIKNKTQDGKQLTQNEIDNLQKNYDRVMNALITCFDFIESCDHILSDCKDLVLFGVIFVSIKDIETDNFELIKRLERYRTWYLSR